jgi:tRNA (cytidine/uridine-2'-O-)-methyltransferase
MRIVLFEPDIPQNTGAVLRLAACLGQPVDLIEPAGFVLDDKRLKRVAMDYAPLADLTRYSSWEVYCADRPPGRLLLLTTGGETPYAAFRYRADDALLLGRESAGVPDRVREAAAARLRIPMRPEARSLNVATAAAMVLGEALRQTDRFPGA